MQYFLPDFIWFGMLVTFFLAIPAWAESVISIGMTRSDASTAGKSVSPHLIDLVWLPLFVVLGVWIFQNERFHTLYSQMSIVIASFVPSLICGCASKRLSTRNVVDWRKRSLYILLIFPATTMIFAATTAGAVMCWAASASHADRPTQYTSEEMQTAFWFEAIVVLSSVIATVLIRSALIWWYDYVPVSSAERSDAPESSSRAV